MTKKGKLTGEALRKHRRATFEGMLRASSILHEWIERVHPEWVAEWLKGPQMRREWLTRWVFDHKTDQWVPTFVEKPESEQPKA